MEGKNQIVTRLRDEWKARHAEHLSGKLDGQQWAKATAKIIKEAKRLKVYGWVKEANNG